MNYKPSVIDKSITSFLMAGRHSPDEVVTDLAQPTPPAGIVCDARISPKSNNRSKKI
jgi:hypothetical protein